MLKTEDFNHTESAGFLTLCGSFLTESLRASVSSELQKHLQEYLL